MKTRHILWGAFLAALVAFSWTPAQAQIIPADPYGPGSLQDQQVLERPDMGIQSIRSSHGEHAAIERPFTEEELENWVPDRQVPSNGWGSVSHLGYDDVLHMGISDHTTTAQHNRTEGVATCYGSCSDGVHNWGTVVEADVYIDPAWEDIPMRAGLWVTGGSTDAAGRLGGFAIIEFTSASDAGSGPIVKQPRWRVWTSTMGWVNLLFLNPADHYGEWVNLRLELNPVLQTYTFSIGGVTLFAFPTSSDGDPQFIREVFLNSYNFGHADENFANPAVFGPEPYDVYWKDLRVEHDMISSAVTHSRSGETVNVAPGSYTDNVVIWHPVTVEGTDAGVEIAAGTNGMSGENNTAFYVRSNDVTLSNLTLLGTGLSQNRGISTESGRLNLTVDNVAAHELTTGIYLNPGTEATITNYTATDNFAGIGTDGPALLNVSGSTFTGNNEGIGFTSGATISELNIGATNTFDDPATAFNIPLGGTVLEYATPVTILAHNWGPSLQTAINDADAGDTILLSVGTHAANTSQLNLYTDDITIAGSGEGVTTIDKSGVNGYGVEWRGSNVTVRDLTLLGPVQGPTTLGATYGFKIGPAPGATTPLTGAQLINVRVQGSHRTEIDFNFVENVVLTNVTADGQGTGGVGIGMISATNVTLTNITTIDNDWGGLAVYTNISSAFPDYAERATDITVNGHTANEDIKFYSQGTDGGYLTGDDLTSVGDVITHTVHNHDHRSNGEEFTFYLEGEETAIDFAATLPNPESSTIRDWPDGDWVVFEGMSLQVAIITANENDTILVEPGVYTTTGQVLIDKNLTIQGMGTVAERSKPVIVPTGNLTGDNVASAWFLVTADVTVTLSDVVLDADGFWVYQALRSHGNTTIDGVDFRNIQGSASGSPYRGIAIASYGGTVSGGGGSDTHGSGGAPAHLVVTNSTFEQIGRIGILIKGDESTADISDNTYTGKGDGNFIDYAVEVGAGGSANIFDNVISENRGVASSDGSSSAGILVTSFYGNGTEAVIENNSISNSRIGLSAGYDDSDDSEVTFSNNELNNNTFQVRARSHQIALVTASLAANTFDRAVVVRENPIVVPVIFSSIQNAIDAAEGGQIIEVHSGSGTYATTGQVLIDTDLTITGVGSDKPVISPGGDVHNMSNEAWWFVAEDTDFTLSNVELNGDGHRVAYAIRSHGNTTVDAVDFRDIRSATYVGFAIASFGGTVGGGAGANSHGSGGAPAHLTVTNSTFEQIQRGGLLVKGTESTAVIEDNTYTGKGEGNFIDYFIDLGAGGNATLTGNTISNNRGVADSDGSTSAAIMVTTFWGAGTAAVIEENIITNNTTGITVGYNENDTSEVTAHHNQLSGNDTGVSTRIMLVDARYNFWGEDNGPSSADPMNPVADPVTDTLAEGDGDVVGENVRFDPWIGKPADVVVGDGGEGWYMLSAPVDGATVLTLAEANVVYGIPGEYEEETSTNLFTGYDGHNDMSVDARGFVIPAGGLSHPLVPGKGFIWYLHATGGTPSGTGQSTWQPLPSTINYTGSPVVETHTVTFEEDERSDVHNDGFYLIGNPYSNLYNVGGIVPEAQNIIPFSGTLNRWSTAANAYIPMNMFNGDTAPVGSGFFLQLGTPANPAAFPVRVHFTSTPILGPPAPGDEPVRFTAHFELTGNMVVYYEGQEFPMEISDLNNQVILAEDATDNFDVLDAGKLTPLSYYWANIALMGMHDDEMVRRLIESRPIPTEAVSIPMAFSTHANGLEAGGSFTISLADVNLAEGWRVDLTDLETGESVDMLTDSHTFTIEAQPAINADERFLITFTPPPVSGEDGGEGYVFGMDPIWPNPTVHTSQVAFTLEEAGEIRMEMFDMLGRRVGQVANGEYNAGRHVLPLNTQSLASGVYVVRLIAGSQSAVQRVTVAR